MERKPVRAWHFAGKTLRDGRPIPPNGVTLRHDGPLVMCKSGLHASLHPFDVLQYAPGNTLCLVECGGEIEHDTNKLVCSERTIIARIDATALLRYFARMQALSVIHLWDAPQVVLDYLMGDDEARAAAWAATSYAARDVARAAARDATWAEARAAAWTAASYVARDEARAAARAAAWAATWAEARDAARDDFAALVHETFEEFLK